MYHLRFLSLATVLVILLTITGCWRKKICRPADTEASDKITTALHELDLHTVERLSGPAGAPELLDNEDAASLLK